jgi:hypothetical protein
VISQHPRDHHGQDDRDRYPEYQQAGGGRIRTRDRPVRFAHVLGILSNRAPVSTETISTTRPVVSISSAAGLVLACCSRHRPVAESARVGAYETALDRLGEAARHVDVLVPGHGAVAEGPGVAARLAADHAYIDALRRGEEPVDARLGQDWLSGPHQSNLEQARHASG